VDQVDGKCVFIHDLVMNRPNNRHPVEESGGSGEVLANPDSGHNRLDRLVIRARFLRIRRGIPHSLGVEGIDLGHSATQPQKDAMVRSAT
jgi:hypothetical protein